MEKSLISKIYRGNWARDENVNEVMVTKGELILTPMYNRGRRECEFTPIKYQQSAVFIVFRKHFGKRNTAILVYAIT